MELDDMKSAWQALDRRLAQQNAIGLQLLADGRMQKAKSSLRWLQVRSILQMVLGVALTIFFAIFWLRHSGSMALLLSGIVMHAYSVGLIITGAVEMSLIARIDYASQVVAIQTQLARLRQWRTRVLPWMGLSQWILWIPETLILFAYWLRIDLWAHSHGTVYIFFAIGIAGLLATLWLMHWSPAALRTRVGDYLDDTNAGASLKRAQNALDEIRSFERE